VETGYILKERSPATLHPTLSDRVQIPPPWGDGDSWWINQYQGASLGVPGLATGTVDLNRFHELGPLARGERVRWVQRRLGIAPSGDLDTDAERALRAFRERNAPGPDARADLRTFAFLCGENPA